MCLEQARYFLQLLKGVKDYAPNSDVASENLSLFDNFSVSKPDIVGHERTQQVIDTGTTIERFVRVAVVAEKARVWPETRFSDYASAKNRHVVLVNELRETTNMFSDNDTLYSGLRAITRVVSGIIPAEAKDLPELQTITLNKPMPAIVVVYDRFGDITRGEDLIYRNKVRHPGRVPPRRGLSVLDV